MHDQNVQNQRLRKTLEEKEDELLTRRKALGLPLEQLSRPGSALARPGSARRPRTAESAVEAILGLATESHSEGELRSRNAALRAEIAQARDNLMGLRAGAL